MGNLIGYQRGSNLRTSPERHKPNIERNGLGSLSHHQKDTIAGQPPLHGEDQTIGDNAIAAAAIFSCYGTDKKVTLFDTFQTMAAPTHEGHSRYNDFEATKQEMNMLYPKLSVSDILMIDDYGHWVGAEKYPCLST